MKIAKILENNNFELVTKKLEVDNSFDGIYACDLLSMVMANAEEDNILLTVIANKNTLAVAKLLDLSCVVITSKVRVDDEMVKKAEAEKIVVIKTNLNTVEAIREIDKLI